MTLTLSSWFNEPGIRFKVSYKIYKLIRHLFIEEIMKPFKLEEKEPNTFIGIVTATSSNTNKLEVRGPKFDKKNNFINYGLWLPYKQINESENFLKEFLNYYFEALSIVFDNYGVPKSAIMKVQEKVELEVLNNDEYSYDE